MPFAYLRPTSLPEAIALLAQDGGRARPLAGGTDLLVQLRAERYQLDRVVDIKAIPELAELRYDPVDGLTLGAAVPCYRIYEDPAILAHYPGLVDAVSILGGVAIQGRATVGGNLCNASPSADVTPVLAVMGAICMISGPLGSRTVAVAEFCTAPGQTSLDNGELLVSIQVPAPAPNSGAAYLRFTPRREMDIAVAGAAAWVALADDQRTIAEARLALAAVGPTMILVDHLSEALVGTDGGEAALEAAARRARDSARPITDMRGSASQRRHLAGVLAKRVLQVAIERARQAFPPND
ncbi:MAG: xanthine dehydrogenase family protein subunit M [Chloroflexi bacterium]|nr:xanthine dehydrogenase family protein subunit M [Chloroflexota bacterium]